MSDDTPTQRFDAAGDTPTERIAAADTAEVPSEEVVEERKSRKLMLTLGIIGGLLLLGVIVLLVLLLTRGSGEPSTLPTGSASPTPSASATPSPTASATPSPTPTPTPTETVAPPPPPPPPPPSTEASVDSFTINPTSVSCDAGDPVITIQWSTSNANSVYFGIDTNDASTGPFFGDSLPASGNSTNDFPDGYRPFTYTCGNGSHTYVITAVGSDGSKDTKKVTVTE